MRWMPSVTGASIAALVGAGCAGSASTTADAAPPTIDAVAVVDRLDATSIDTTSSTDARDGGLADRVVLPGADVTDATFARDVNDSGDSTEVSDTPDVTWDPAAPLSEDCPLTEGVALTWTRPQSGTQGRLCGSFNDVLSIYVVSCRPQNTLGPAVVRGTDYRVYFEAGSGFFDVPGPNVGGFALDDAEHDCATTDPACRFVRRDFACAMSVTHAGSIGDVVEARLAAPCELTHDSPPVSTVILTSAVVRGTLFVTSAGAQPHDAGLPDCGG